MSRDELFKLTGSESNGIAVADIKDGYYPETVFNASVLVAEDNPVNQEVAKMMLEVMGCRVAQAENGKQAVEMALRSPYDLILMDCQMPEMDGFEATGMIRQNEQDGNGIRGGMPRVTIIAMTGNSTDEDRSLCLSRGMDDFLRKPFTFEDLRRMLARWLPVELAQTTRQQEDISFITEDSPIDYRYLDNIRSLQRDGGPDILGRVLHSYLCESPRTIEQLGTAVDADNREVIRAVAHRFKSGSANVGALRLAEICRELENNASTDTVSEKMIILTRLEKEYEAVKVALTAVRQGAEK